MADTITLDNGVDSATTLPAPLTPGPMTASSQYPMAVGRTLGGGVLTADMGDGTVHTEFSLTFELTATEYDNLKSFLTSANTNWSEKAFTFTDSFSVAHTNMHYIGGFASFQVIGGNIRRGTIQLAKDQSA